ncbi:FapA family protein [Helicobacter pylori]|uniref:FapA family protein n=1 Tax=Helicobacter pylori TaxID=210 RepID=UPI00165C09C5|nr:FapA family protein [Helicobacter pylori]WQS20438.1 FapA family protein [Helicobacter pylori]WQS29774.1 FapA family protein [Helicobacter pylori]
MSLEHFAPIKVERCKDIQKELKKAATENKLQTEDLWFEILKTSIFIKNSTKDDFSEAFGGELQQLEEDEYYEKKELTLYQTHDIKIKSNAYKRFFEVKVDEHLSKIEIVLDECFIVLDTEEHYQEMFAYIKECLAFQGVVFRHLSQMYENLKTELRKYKKEAQNKRFILYASSTFIPNIEEQSHFLLEEEYLPTHIIRDQEESFVKENDYIAKENQKVACVNYPKQGKDGRNLKGLYIELPKVANSPTPIGHDKNAFEEREENNALVYYSKALQGVKMEKGRLVSNQNFIFKNGIKSIETPNLLGGVESGLVLEVQAKDELSDAIDSNLILEASAINIKGNVGKNVILVAKEITIEGQIHPESYVYANKARITNHKGVCYAKEFECKYLERAKVYANSVKVEASAGSVVYAKEIALEKLKSDNKLYFSKQCLIDEVDGNGNRFIFYAFGGRENQEELKAAKQKLNALGLKSKKIIAQHQSLNHLVKNHQAIMEKLKNATEEIKRSLMQQESVKDAYSEFVFALKRLKILKAQMLELQKINNECYAKLISIENSFQHASVMTKNPFKQENIVIYHRNYPKVSNLSVMLSHNESVNVIYEDHKIKKVPKSAIKG